MIGRKGQCLFICVFALLLGLTLASSARAYIEPFNSLPLGWTVNDIDNLGTTYAVTPTWSATGGNPDGMLSGLAGSSSRRLNSIFIWPLPSNPGFWGDLTGMALTTDFKISGSVTGAKDTLAWFFIQSSSNWYYSKLTWNPNADTEWTAHTVALTEDNFFGSAPGNFAETLKNYELMGIFFGTQLGTYEELGLSSAAGATLSIDNFGVVPAPLPPSVILLGSGFIVLAGWRGVRKS